MSTYLRERLKPNGDAIITAREENGFSQTDLAKRVRASQATISRVEAGEESKTELLIRIANVLHLPLSGIASSPLQVDVESSRTFQARKCIIKGIATRQIPTGGRVLTTDKERIDVRDYVECEWDCEEYRELGLDPSEADAVWRSLIADGIIEYAEGCHFVTMPTIEEFEHLIFLDYGNLIGLTSMAIRLPFTQRQTLATALEDLRDTCAG